MGLLENDQHWFNTLHDAQLTMTPRKIRELFAILITNCGLSQPFHAWHAFKNCMTLDILTRIRQTSSCRFQ